MDFIEAAKKQYEALCAEEAGLKSQLDGLREKLIPLKAYLRETGVLQKQKRKAREQ